jgi:hypothetical protein
VIQHHKYSLDEIENMIPYERDLYVQLLISHLKQVEEQMRKNG